MHKEIRYNTIGYGYNTTRTADPFITQKIFDLLHPPTGGLFLDIGCGTGNYLQALSKMGLQFIGADPSEVMLAEARAKNTGTQFVQTKAEQLPVDNNYFDGAIAVLTLHHWDDIGKGLKELHRVLKPDACWVSFSFTPEQVMGYWLHHYFPKMIERSSRTIPAWTEMEKLLSEAGFTGIRTEPYYIQPDLKDHFLYSHKTRPEQYLNPEIRKNISSFTSFSDPAEVSAGLIQLETDILSGKINEVMHQYNNRLGDYLFIQAVA